MKKFYCVLSLCFFLIQKPLFSQDVGIINANNASILQSGFTQIGADAWAAGGAFVARLGLPTTAFLNPAGLAGDNFSIYIESGRRLKSDYDYNLNLDNQLVLPAFIGLNKSFQHFILSAGYLNSYNYKVYVEFPVRTIESPDEPIGISELTNTIKLHSFYGSFNYKLHSNFQFGFTAIANYLSDNGEIDFKAFDDVANDNGERDIQTSGDGLGFGFIAGGLFTLSEEISLGIGFRWNDNIEYVGKLSGDYKSSFLDTSNVSNVYDLIARFPWSAQFGITIKPMPVLTISAMLDYQKWSRPGSNFKNQLQRHFGIEYQFSNAFGLSLGIFTMNNPAEDFFNGSLDQNFLTAGFSVKLSEQLKFSASVLDAHLLTDNDFQQTYIMVGLQY